MAITPSVTASPVGKVKEGKDEDEKSWGQKVTELCHLLALCPPTYRAQPTDPEVAGNILSCAAYFPYDPTVVSILGQAGGPVGEVRHVLGKKRAREECARGVWQFLEAIRRRRVGGLGDKVKEKERKGSSSEESD
jgi:hypothetical protein